MKKTIGLLLLLTILTLTSCTTAADARIAEAQIAGQVQMERERQETQRATAWYSVLPWLVLALGAVVAVSLELWFRGKAHLVVVQAQAAMMLPSPPQWPALPGPVQRAAIERNATAMPDPAMPGAWLLLLTDGRRVRMLPPPPQRRQEY